METARGSNLDKMSMTRTLMGRRCGRAIGGIACVQAAKVSIETDGAISLMGGKDDVRGGEGFHEVNITGKCGMMGGRETT